MRVLSLLLLGSCLLACGDDSPPPATSDAATDRNLVWRPPDSGLSFEDVGAPDTPTGDLCTPFRLMDAQMPRCTMDTYDCVVACAGDGADACRNACQAADTYPPADGLNCSTCLIFQTLECLYDNGCQAETSNFFCCAGEKCPDGSDEGCVERECADEATAMFTCGVYNAAQCFDYAEPHLRACVAAPGFDAGVPDARSPDAGTMDAAADSADGGA